jgi:hypothetical protein
MSAFADSRKTLSASLECPEGHIEFFLGAVSTAGQQRIDFLYTLSNGSQRQATVTTIFLIVYFRGNHPQFAG